MMLRWRVACLLVLGSVPLWPASNGVTVYDRTGSEQTNVPMTVMAVLARGEAPHFARPVLTVVDKGGKEVSSPVTPEQWQSDVKSRWRDGARTVAIGAVANPATPMCASATAPCDSSPYVRITTAEPHDFRDGERVSIANASIPALNGTWTVADRADTQFSLAGLAKVENPGSASGEVSGPANGSWATGLVTVFIPSIPANGGVRIDFIDAAEPSHNPSDLGLTREQFAERNWDAVIQASAPAKAGLNNSVSVSAREILRNAPAGDCGVRPWLAGPLATEYIIEDNCSAPVPQSDFGWAPAKPVTTAAGASLPAAQNSGDQTITLTAPPAFTASPENPALLHYMTGGPSILNPSFSIEFFLVCGIDGMTLKICPDGRGAWSSPPRAIPAGAMLGVMQTAESEPIYRQLHPWFMVRAYTQPDGAPHPAVRIRYAIANGGAYRPGTAYYSATLLSRDNQVRWRSGVPLGEYANNPAARPFLHAGGEEWSKVFWDGADPEHSCGRSGGMDPCISGERTRRWLLDANLAQKVAAGFILPFDQREMGTGARTPFQAEFDAFSKGDRADAASPMNLQGKYGLGAYKASILHLGYANYSSKDNNRTGGGAADADREEGWIWSRALARALPVLGSEPRAWEMLFGTSVPGGAGLQAAEHHLPINWFENSPAAGGRQFTISACESCTAFGRPMSIDARPTIYMLRYGTASTAADRLDWGPWTAGTGNLWTNAYPAAFLINDQSLDQAHRQPHSPYLYLVTGDYYDLRQTQNWASWLLAFKNPAMGNPPGGYQASSFRRSNWGIQMTSNNHVRAGAWAILGVAWGAALSPNVPPPGGAAPPPERYYYEAKLAKTFQAWEGMIDMADGWFPPRNRACNDIDASLSARTPSIASTNDPWCWGRIDMGRGWPVVPLHITVRPDTVPPDGWVERSKTGGGQSPYNLAQLGIALWQTKRMGFDFVTPIFERHGRMSINMFLNSQLGGPYLATYYRWPWTSAASSYTYEGPNGPETVAPTSYYPSWGALRDAFLDEKASPVTWESLSRIMNEYGYAHYWRASLAAWVGTGLTDSETPGCRAADRPPNGCTADEAYRLLTSMIPNLNEYKDAKRTAQVPADAIQVETVTAASNDASVRFKAPAKAACVCTLDGPARGASPRRITVPAGQAVRNLQLEGLAPSSAYRLWMQCGGARMSVPLKTRPSPAAAVLSRQIGGWESGVK